MLRVLANGGAASCGCIDQHDYPLNLAINDIDHTEKKAMSPQTKGLSDTFYPMTFRKKLHSTLAGQHQDLDD